MHRIILSIGTNFNCESNAKLVKGIISEAFHKVQFSEELLTEPVGNVMNDVPSISFGPGLQQAFADGTMDKGDLIRKIQELGWKVME